MGPRRRRLAGVLAIALLALAGLTWFGATAPEPESDAEAIPATGSAPGLASRGRPHASSRIGQLLAWVRRQLETPPDPEPAPTPFVPPPTPGPPGALEVVVRQEGGSAIVGARVVLFGPPGAPVLPAALTDGEGRVTFADVPSSPGYAVHAAIPRADARGGDLGGRRADVRANETTQIVIERPAFRVEGEVRDAATGDPVAEADVEAFDVGAALASRREAPGSAWSATAFGDAAPAPRVGATVTTADGRFRLDAGDAEHVELRVRAPDGRAGTRLVLRDAARAPTHVLVRAARACEGVVVDATGRPRPGLRLSAPTGISPSGEGAVAATDAAGHFVLPVLAAGPYARLVVEGEGVPRFATRVLVDRDLRVVVPGSAALDLRVVEDRTDRPQLGARVLATVGATTTEATTDADGRARLETTGGPVEVVRVSAAGLREVALGLDGGGSVSADPAAGAIRTPLEPGETRSVTVRLRRGAVVVGRVLDGNGAPAERVTVSLSTGWSGPTPTARSGADGRFAIAGLVEPPAGWTRGVRAYGDGGALGSFDARVPADAAAVARGTIDLGDVALHRGAVVRARVVDAEGRPVPGASAQGHVAALADEEGGLTLAIAPQLLDPAGTVVFDVAAPGFRTREVRCAARLAPGEVRDLPPIRLEGGVGITLEVLDEHGRPVAGCSVRWTWNGETTPVRTDAAGRAVLSGAASDAEGVEVTLPDGARFTRHGSWAQAPGGRTDFTLRLPPLRPLAVRIVDERGAAAPFAGASTPRTPSPTTSWVAEERWAAADATGVVRWTSVVATPLRLRARAPGFVTQEFAVDATATTATVTLEPRGAASERRRAEALASLERLERELAAQDPDDDGEEARARFRRQQELRDEVERLSGR